MTESLLLSALGTIAGLLIAIWGRDALLGLINNGSAPLHLAADINLRVLAFTVAAMILTGLGFGLVPAWQASRANISIATNDQSRGTGGRGKQRVARALVAAQVACSLVLLIGAGLLARSLTNLRNVDLGFKPDQVVVFDLNHNPANADPAMLAQLAQQVQERVMQIPEVRSASVSGLILFGPGDANATLKIRDYVPSSGESPRARFNAVSPGYFQTVGMDLIAGRDLDRRDAFGAPPVVVVNQALANSYFHGANPLGQIIGINSGPLSGKPVEIVGVVRDSKFNDLRTDVKPMFYVPLQQWPRTLRSLEVRTTASLAVVGPVRQALLELNREIMIRRAGTLWSQVDRTLAAERLIGTLSAVFSGIALLLASVGLYGVMSFAVVRRTPEIGIRMALGATRRHVLLLVARQSMGVVCAGVMVGVVLAVIGTRLISGFLFGLSRVDPLTFGISIIALFLVASVACLLPARRAASIEPSSAIRAE